MANVTDKQMKTYLRTFHDEYAASVEQYVPAEDRQALFRYSLLPAPVMGYVSTQFGAGYEYGIGDANISIRRGSRRVEELFVDGPARLSRLEPWLSIGGPCVVKDCSFKTRFPFRLTNEVADVSFSRVIFETDNWRRSVLYAHVYANRREEFWSEAEAIRRAKDEVLAALLDLKQSEARNVDRHTYVEKFKQKQVLVLGDFGERRDRLEAIRSSLIRAGYDAFLLDDVPEVPHCDLRQKFQLFALLSRFVVFEDSTPSGHVLEMESAESLRAIRIVLREGDKRSTYMTQGMDLTSKVVREWSYEVDTLDSVIAEAAEWAESLVIELEVLRDEKYPWRNDAA